MAADLVIPAVDAEALREIVSWDGHRAATFAASDFPVDVLRLAGNALSVSARRARATATGGDEEPASRRTSTGKSDAAKVAAR